MMTKAARWPLFVCMLGIPAAGVGAILFDVQLSRLIYGQANPLLLAVEIGSLITVVALVLLLRARLALPSAPGGFWRHVLDFLAVSRWEAAVRAALAGLVLLPLAWFVLGNRWMFTMFASLGRQALALSDVRAGLDGGAVIYQHALTGGLPLLFVLHLLCRWQQQRRVLAWLLVPVFFFGTAVAMVIILTAVHFGD